jgi:hypothetical protein
MKMTIFAVLLLGAALTADAPADSVQPSAADQLSWIAGCWTLTQGDVVVEEHWMKPAGGTLLGMGRTVRNGQTSEYEFLQIRDVDGQLAYIAKPSGQPEATFTLRTMGEAEATFENPDHDFPQRVTYRRTAEGITARIEGTRNGQTRSVDYAYKRCP